MVHKIKSLYDEGRGSSIRQIAKELCLSRNTVNKYITMTEEELNEYLNNRDRAKVLDYYKDYIKRLLRKYPKLSSVKIKKKLDSKGMKEAVSDRTFRRYVKELKKKNIVKQERYYEPVIDMVAGVQCQVDLGELRGLTIGGMARTVYFTVFVLSYSRLMYVSVSYKPIDTKAFITMHDEAFSYFDGVVEECVYDQTKLVAIKEEFREVWFNEEFYRYATCARFDIRVCKGYDPESKGKVEAGVRYVKNNFFYGEEFSSFEEVKEALVKWLQETANVRVHGTTKKKPRQVYDTQEYCQMTKYLRPSFLEYDSGSTRQVDKTSLISHKSNKYSVPMKYQSSVVKVKEEGVNLVIRDSATDEVIATHPLCPGKGTIIKNTNHYRDYEKLISDKEEEIAVLMGKELSEKLCKVIKKSFPRHYKDQLAGLLKVLKKFSDKEDLPETVRLLEGNPRLTVTYIRDYLSAFYSDSHSSVKDSVYKTGSLASYGALLSGGQI